MAPELEEWIDATRRRLRAVAATAAWRVATEAETGGQMAEAVRAARRAVELAPDDEPGVRRLIALLAKAGDRLSALSTYEELVGRLKREFGADPSPETVALGRRLRSRPPPPRPKRPPPAVPPPAVRRACIGWWPAAIAGLAVAIAIAVGMRSRRCAPRPTTRSPLPAPIEFSSPI